MVSTGDGEVWLRATYASLATVIMQLLRVVGAVGRCLKYQTPETCGFVIDPFLWRIQLDKTYSRQGRAQSP